MSRVEDPPQQVSVDTPSPPREDDVAWAPPVAGGGAQPRERRRLRTAAIVALVVGSVLAAFMAYELWFSGLLQSRAQSALLRDFKASLVLDDTASLITPPVGRPVGVMQLPRTGGEQVVVQGIGSDQTKDGPGHDPSTPAPGQTGNSVIVGRSLTYGAPFGQLDQLQQGDSVIFTTRQGQFVYSVESSTTKPLGDQSVAAPTTDDRLTLIGLDPGLGSPTERVVVASLQGKGLQVPAPLPPAPAGLRPGRSTLMDGRWGAILLWGELFLLALAGTAYLYRRRWNLAVTYLLTTPILITLSILFFRAADTLLPPSL
jgi:sortase A